MSDKPKRAALAALCAREPWLTAEGPVTAADVRALYAVICNAKSSVDTAGLGLAGRRSDRALQLLRKAKLIKFDYADVRVGKKQWLPT